MRVPTGSRPRASQIPQQSMEPSRPAQQTAPPRGMSRETKIVVIVVVSVISVVIIIGVAFTWWILSQGLVSSNGGNRRALGFTPSSTGGNWTLTVASVHGNMRPSEIMMTIYDMNGVVKNPMSSIPLSQLTSTEWPTYRVTYQKTVSGNFIVAGDTILVHKQSYPSGYRYQIRDDSSILATGTFQ